MYRKLFRNCSTVSIGLIVSRLSGVVKLAIVASIFGTGDAMDSFLVAMAIPTAVLTIAGEGIYVGAVRLISRHRGPAGDGGGSISNDGWAEISSLFNFSVAGTAAFSAAYWVFSPAIISLVAPGFSEQKLAQADMLARCLAPVAILTAVQNVLHAILHVHDRFAVPALKFLIFSTVAIVVVLALHSRLGIAAYALGDVMGELTCCFVCYLAVKRIGGRYAWAWRRGRSLRESIRMGVPTMAGAGVLQVTPITDRMFASGLAAGSISALGYGLQLLMVPLSFVRTIVDVGFPEIANIFHKPPAERDEPLRQAVRVSFTMLAVAAVPAAVVLLIWRRMLIALLLERGQFDAVSAEATAIAVFFYSFALIPMVARYFMTRLSQSFGDSLTPLPAAVISAASNIALNLLLVPVMGHAAIPVSLSVGTALGAAVLYAQLRRKVDVLRKAGIESIAVRTIAAGAVMFAVYTAAERLSGSTIAAGCAAAAAYGAGLMMAGVVRPQYLLRIASFPILARGKASV